MDTTGVRRKTPKIVHSHNLNDSYPHDLSLYLVSPDSSIQLSEFEDLALERLQLLRIIEQATFKSHKPFSDDWKQCIKEDLAKENLRKYVRFISGNGINNINATEQDLQARRADHISHFILRLAYCRSGELRSWFLNREIEWFKLRFLSQHPQSIRRFLQINNLQYTPIDETEKNLIKNEIIASSSGLSEAVFAVSEYYKVPFVEVCSLVRQRKVYLSKGFAYVSASDLFVVIQTKFRSILHESLNICQHRLSSLDDERIDPLVATLPNTYTGKNYTTNVDKESIDPRNLDSFSKQHYPLCMRHLHNVVRSVHHLKHGARLQYGLFLKGIGLLYQNAVEFWREEFTKSMDANKFDKQYLYNIDHQYGRVGNHVNYSPYSCMKIIMGNVGPGEQHGCPFRHWDANNVKLKLTEYGVSSEGIKEIIDLVNNGHFQLACAKYFEYTHNKAPPNAIIHPNQYFEDSMSLSKETKQDKSNQNTDK